MNRKAVRLLYEWVELVMYIVASLPISQADRDALGYKTRELQDELAKGDGR